MKRFELLVDDERQTLEFDRDVVSRNGRRTKARVSALGPEEFAIELDGSRHVVQVCALGNGRFETWQDGSRLIVEVLDPRRLSRQARDTGGGGSSEIRVPMPGKVVAVHVTEGEAVRRGQGLVVVEAMKMQNELRAPRDGVVASVRAQAGDSVAAGTTLAVIA